MRIAILDGYTLNPGDNPWDGIRALGEVTLHERTREDQIVERAAGADVVITNKIPFSAAVLEQLPALRMIAVTATGYNIIDIKTARTRGITVCNVPVYGTDSVAQFIFAQLLELCHHVTLHDRAVRDGEWGRSGDFCFWKTPLTELAGLRMGIVGFGRIGRRVGKLAHAFGMEVLADASRGEREPPAYAPFRWCGREALFREADVISLNCPLTADNERFVNANLLRLMKPTAFLINASRGALIDEAALTAALNTGRLAGAAVDVASREPMEPGNPLLAAKNCLITPHIAWATLAARRRLMHTTVENIRAFLAGTPVNVVS